MPSAAATAFGAALVVAGQHHRLDAELMQTRHRIAGRGLDRIAEGQQAEQLRQLPILADQPRHRAAITLQLFGTRSQLAGIDAELAQQPAAAERQRLPFDLGLQPAAWQRLRFARFGQR